MQQDEIKQLIIPPDIDPALDGTSWRAWLSPTSPFKSRENGRIAYESWLKDDQLAQHGLYLWLQPLPAPAADEYRFIHVGLSKQGGSTIAKRTLTHLKYQFSVDRIHRLTFHPEKPFGSLGPSLRVDPMTEEAIAAAEAFLRTLRILFLTPTFEDRKEERIALLEGFIARSAAELLGMDEITNMVSKTANVAVTPEQAERLASALNSVTPMLPSQTEGLKAFPQQTG